MTETQLTLHEQIEKILLKFATSEMDEMGVQQGAISKNELLFTLDEANQALTALFQQALTSLACDKCRVRMEDKLNNGGTQHG